MFRQKQMFKRRKEMGTVWSMDDIPYDAMGDYSAFIFDFQRKEERPCADPERDGEGADPR